MKYNLYCKENLDKEILKEKINTTFENAVFSDNPEFVFTFGGDGTFLDGLHRFGHEPLYVPVNMGTLGFYTSWNMENFNNIKEDMVDPNVLSMYMLDIEVYKKDNIDVYRCLNEATLINPINTQILDINVNDIELEKFRGTGICISTATGSTAYNKSLGGSIISADKKLFQMMNIAAINNAKYRTLGNSLILGENEVLSFETNKKNFENTILTVDRKSFSVKDVEKISISLSEQKLKILMNRDSNFYTRLKKAFM